MSDEQPLPLLLGTTDENPDPSLNKRYRKSEDLQKLKGRTHFASPRVPDWDASFID